MSSKLTDFLVELDRVGTEIILYTQKVDRLVNKAEDAPKGLQTEVSNFKHQLSKIADAYETIAKTKGAKEYADSYFANMQRIELKRIVSDLHDLKRGYDNLYENVLNPSKYAPPKSDDESDDTSDSDDASNPEVDRQYSEYLTVFLRNHLKFECPHCHQTVLFAEQICDSCKKSIKWTYNQQEIFNRLGEVPKNYRFTCPAENCGARIELDWETCAVCDLDLQKMLLSHPNFN